MVEILVIQYDLEVQFGRVQILMLIKIQQTLMVSVDLILQKLLATRLRLGNEIPLETLQIQTITITLLWTLTLLQVEEYQEEAIVVRLVQQH